MKRNRVSLLLASSLFCTQLAAEPGDVAVSVTTADQARLGIASRMLDARTVSASVDAIIRSVDPSPLAALNSDLLAATAAAAASDSELKRVAGLVAQDRSASQQALELARARAAADAAAASLLRRRLELEWGPGFASQTDAARQKLIEDVGSGAAALLRADAPRYPDGIMGRVFVELRDNTEIATTELLGLSGTTDQRMQTVGLFCVVRGEPAKILRPGRVVSGRIETNESLTGVVLPRSALIRSQGKTWAYVRTGAEEFARREVIGGLPVADGWYVAEGFEPGTEIVDEGVGSMIGVERADEAAEEN